MGLESATFISGLTSSWPPSGDPKSQGDDHLRLIKNVLQSTFPNANAAFYLPSVATQFSGAIPLTAQNQTLFYDTSGGNFAVTLPASPPAGWACEILKYTTDQNAITVSPASGQIFSAVGGVATVRVGACGSIARFVSSGGAWFCSKHGPLVGTTVNWDGAGVPAGHLVLDGSTFSGVTFAELNLALGSTTLRDKRGRADIGSGTGAGLTNRALNVTYGAEAQALSATHLPPQTPAGSVSVSNGVITINQSQAGLLTRGVGGGGNTSGAGPFLIPDVSLSASQAASSASFTGSAFPGQVSTAFGLLQPSIGTQKLIRAC